ncbi:peptidase M24 [Acidimicrobium ferrooxidans DSM 10331]|uniref:Peptidase M24 n=1 Tax=Acidimicrobium ferrooxidans (strain DSM 10331 / JCM 15462 / NBRC 103882 / ICP) TaxID=525909 RepID=C7M0X0_ACIFD|nr:Xaa-Pro peptidase family protein [Acidimicrobium ferrooxidans]ACU54628.1 peptidase M24 [Acidimicrobium ferrooxidans DSM 10331]
MHTQDTSPRRSLSLNPAALDRAPGPSMVGQVRGLLSGQAATTLVVVDPAWIRYLTGFDGSHGTLLIDLRDEDRHLLCTDGRYVEAAGRALGARGLDGLVEVLGDDPLTTSHHRDLLRAPLALLGSCWSLSTLRLLMEIDPTPIDAQPLLWPLRAVKQTWELERIRAAARLADDAMDAALASLADGPISERLLAATYEFELRARGADEPAFATIVAAGSHASEPHARPSERLIRPGDILLVDFGATVDGYRSDATRTMLPSEGADPRVQAYWDIVAAAQRAGIAAATVGASAHDIETAARAVLREAGVEELLLHGVGHALGLEIHERPFTAHDRDPLAEGTVITVEPGLYVPGELGIRLEDTILVGAEGPECLTRPATESRTRPGSAARVRS